MSWALSCCVHEQRQGWALQLLCVCEWSVKKLLYLGGRLRCTHVFFQVYEDIGEGADELDLGGSKVNMRAYCSWFNFRGADQQKKLSVLSGGERNRLQLAKVGTPQCVPLRSTSH